MGYDQHQQSSSSGAVVAIVVTVLLVGILGLLAGAGLLWVGTVRMESQPATIDVQLADQDQATTQLQHFSDLGTERLNFEVKLDREGNTSIDGKEIDLDELRARLAKLKDETSNAFSVRINADPECPAKLLIPVLDVCEEVGDIDFRVVLAKDENPSDDTR